MNKQTIFVLSCALFACDASLDEPPYRAQIIVADEDYTRYSLREVELARLEDFPTLTGQWVKMRRGGELVIREQPGSVVTDETFAGAEDPHLRYEVDRGVALPLDYPSMIMMSAYFTFDDILNNIGDFTGLTAAELTEGRGPFQAIFEPSTRVERADLSTRSVPKHNAFYDGTGWNFGLVQRSETEKLPIAIDANVLSHEVGHAVFDKLFFSFERCDLKTVVAENPFFPGRLTREYAMRGLNEGFSDFLSFAFTGVSNLLANQFSGANTSDKYRTIAENTFTYDDLLSKTNQGCRSGPYCIGTLAARSLYQTFTQQGLNIRSAADRGSFGTDIYGALSRTLARMKERNVLPAASSSALECQTSATLYPEVDGQILGAFWDAFILEVPVALRQPLCSNLIAQFGETGFPLPFREGCNMGDDQ